MGLPPGGRYGLPLKQCGDRKCDPGRGQTNYFRIQSPSVGDDVHLGPSAAPPLGQKTDTSVSVGSQLTVPSAWTARTPPVAGSPLAPEGPGGPAGPAGPIAPAGPTAPTSPLSPLSPFSPCGPCGP